MWKKAVMIATVVIAIIISFVSLTSRAGVTGNFNMQVYGTEKIPFSVQGVDSVKFSGSWSGSGSAQVWLVTEDSQYLAFDTRSLPASFSDVCVETCDMPTSNVMYLSVYTKDGTLTLSEYSADTSSNPSGLAACPNCKSVRTSNSPDHSILLLSLVLTIAIFGSHSLHHCCKRKLSKKVLVVLFVGAFLTMGGVFGVSLTAPSGAAVIAKQAASVFAALALLVIFVIAAIELRASEKTSPINSSVWEKLEEAEEEWSKK